MAVGGATRFMRYVGEFLPVRSMHGPSILHPEPLRRTLARLVDFDQLGENIREQQLALGVVAAPAYGNRSVVFHQGGIPRHREDPLRGIEYVATPELGPEHILASSAIPALFPAVRVTTPEPAAGWYYDGGSRLNTPIKPALWLGSRARDRDRAQFRRPEPDCGPRRASPTSTSGPRTCCTPRSATRSPRTSARSPTQTR